MEWRDIQAKSAEELVALLPAMRAKLVDLRFRAATGALKQVHEIRATRITISRILTQINMVYGKR